jgi:hypothetical protein
MDKDKKTQELEGVDQKVGYFNYTKDNKGWVIKSGRPKVKLRKYLSDLAIRLCKVNDDTYLINKNKLITLYNEGGLQRLNIGYYEMIIARFDELNKLNEK